MHRRQQIAELKHNYQAEASVAELYGRLAAVEASPAAREHLAELEEMEARHATFWAERLAKLGAKPPRVPRARTWLLGSLARAFGNAQVMPLIEVTEQRIMRRYLTQARLFHDDDFKSALAQILQDEKSHAEPLADGAHRRERHMPPPDLAESESNVVERILHGETWHRAGGGFIKDAIYGVNDGLTANLGLVAGVAGATNSNHIVLAAGISGMVAASVSMASGAYLSTKSQREIYEEQVDRERQEIEAMPDEEKAELMAIYRAKGLPREQAAAVADRLTKDKEAWLDALSREELGLVPGNFDSPRAAALSAGVSTFVGALIPIVWFFFLRGYAALLVSAVASLGFLFLVGSAKTLFTAKAWWRSGLEMVVFGSIAAIVTYGVGTLFHATAP